MQIVSWRRAFRTIRKLWTLQLEPGHHWRLPFPIPVQGLVYFASLLAAAIVLTVAPLSGPVVAHVPLTIRFICVPVGVAMFMVRTRVDGRSVDDLADDWLRYLTRSRLTSAGHAVKRGRVGR